MVSMSKSSFDIVMDNRKELVQKLIDNMEKGYLLPRESWNRMSLRPHNSISNISYKGGNKIRLLLSAYDKGYKDNRWMTFKQAKEAGYNIRKGSVGTMCEKWIFSKVVERENPDTKKIEKVVVKLKRPIVNYFTVFNAEQIDGVPELEVKELERNEVLNIAEKFIASSECPIKEVEQDRAFYSPSEDCITLPPRNSFINQEAFLGTALHEMVHSTGHSSRLNRNIENTFGTEQYALEELRAELGAFFIEADLEIDITSEHFNSHTEYLESWITALKNDPNELFRACKDAEEAAGLLEGNYELYIEKENVIDAAIDNQFNNETYENNFIMEM